MMESATLIYYHIALTYINETSLRHSPMIMCIFSVFTPEYYFFFTFFCPNLVRFVFTMQFPEESQDLTKEKQKTCVAKIV